MSYFDKQLELLEQEYQADLQQYMQETANTSTAERRAKGLTWYPIGIRGTELTRGDYINLEVQRTTNKEIEHRFRNGMPVALFSNYNIKTDRIEGIISHVNQDTIKINFRIDELPDWTKDGKLGLDLLFDSNTYAEMRKALKKAKLVKDGDEQAYLLNVLIGVNTPKFNNDISSFQSSKLNESQNAAVNKILQAQDVAIIHGPPGTGKTTTIVEAVLALLKQEKQKILVVAPSNTAVDLLSTKLSEKGVSVLRIGNPSRVSDKIMSLTLDAKITEHQYSKDIKKLKKQAGEFKNMAHKYKRNFGRAEREQRKALFDEAYKIMKQVEDTEQYIVNDVLDKTQVVTATLVGAAQYTLQGKNFDTLIIDEAGQALEPACWIPILKSKKVIMAGDHCQLPPTIKSDAAGAAGLSTTLLEKSVSLHPNSVVMLSEQYRMHKDIMGYSSAQFYNNALKANESVAKKTLFQTDNPLLFIDTAGCGYQEKNIGTSLNNPEEAVFVVNHLEKYLEELASNTNSKKVSIAIISPYKEQVNYIQELVANHPVLATSIHDIDINTVDSFQGQERDVVYISLTRSNDDAAIGFLSDTRRMNVALTRAKSKLVVIGDGATLAKNNFYTGFIAYAEEKEAYKSAWEFIA